MVARTIKQLFMNFTTKQEFQSPMKRSSSFAVLPEGETSTSNYCPAAPFPIKKRLSQLDLPIPTQLDTVFTPIKTPSPSSQKIPVRTIVPMFSRGVATEIMEMENNDHEEKDEEVEYIQDRLFPLTQPTTPILEEDEEEEETPVVVEKEKEEKVSHLAQNVHMLGLRVKPSGKPLPKGYDGSNWVCREVYDGPMVSYRTIEVEIPRPPLIRTSKRCGSWGGDKHIPIQEGSYQEGLLLHAYDSVPVEAADSLMKMKYVEEVSSDSETLGSEDCEEEEENVVAVIPAEEYHRIEELVCRTDSLYTEIDPDEDPLTLSEIRSVLDSNDPYEDPQQKLDKIRSEVVVPVSQVEEV